ncbi:Per1-like protein [Fomitiporia mediterranea MF3/22]|uniref:Per1-like protein n=1 Tax=Fomitiporia mediterranea (strain MF3/22) TaxID=694068 RepID=UPI0004407537|nr:Per1-like protein [Fomitiporia mediterranea MF3/22]EJD06237.1 Per1-like protein [Fomitiporia mediterranea MF3/22]
MYIECVWYKCGPFEDASASAGDRSDLFQRCLAICKQRNCWSQTPISLSLSLRLTRWTCADDCAYSCMHQITDSSTAYGQPVVQYYGKWPFWRFLGMQEPASVLFSLLNFWVHLRGYRTVKMLVPDRHPMKPFMILWSAVNMNAWTWSTIFHVRDKPLTEKLDYFSAALVFITALHSVVTRFFFIGRPGRRTLYFGWTALCIIAFITHISYLSFSPRFDYSYNIIFNLVIGLSHNLLWLLYSLSASYTIIRRFPPRSAPRDYRPKCASQAALGVALTMAAMSLELLDFPPIGRFLDAHALWHAATVPIAVLWYRFLVADALDEGWKQARL